MDTSARPNVVPQRSAGGRASPKPPRQTIPSKRGADTQEAAWVADEDRFVLQQAKKKAAIRVKGGRAQPIDWLAVTLDLVDPARNPLDDEVDVAELDLVDPESVFEGLDDAQLVDLEKGIDTYLALEMSRSNQEYWTVRLLFTLPLRPLIADRWQTMKTICKDRRQRSQGAQPAARGVNSVASDLDKLLGPKTYEELEKLEKQIRTKLQSNEPIDADYWEHLLRSLLVWKAKAKLRKVSQSILSARLGGLRKQEADRAFDVQSKLQLVLRDNQTVFEDEKRDVETQAQEKATSDMIAAETLDPEPLLRLRQEDKSLETMTEKEFATRIVSLHCYHSSGSDR